MAWRGAFACLLWARLEVSGVDCAASVGGAVALEDGVVAFPSVERGGGMCLQFCGVPLLVGGVEQRSRCKDVSGVEGLSMPLLRRGFWALTMVTGLY
eukprot:2766669-Ditylum_brightwellii.AAC.1